MDASHAHSADADARHAADSMDHSRTGATAHVPIPGFGGPPLRGFNVRNATLTEFASVMQAQFMDQPVVDQTGLGDVRYTFVLKFTPDASMRPFGGAPPPTEAQPAATDPD